MLQKKNRWHKRSDSEKDSLTGKMSIHDLTLTYDRPEEDCNVVGREQTSL